MDMSSSPAPFAEKNRGVAFPGHRGSLDPLLEAGPLASVSSAPRNGVARVTSLVGSKCLSSAVRTPQRAGQTWSPRTERYPSGSLSSDGGGGAAPQQMVGRAVRKAFRGWHVEGETRRQAGRWWGPGRRGALCLHCGLQRCRPSCAARMSPVETPCMALAAPVRVPGLRQRVRARLWNK